MKWYESKFILTSKNGLLHFNKINKQNMKKIKTPLKKSLKPYAFSFEFQLY
jgi:hypothetical protein